MSVIPGFLTTVGACRFGVSSTTAGARSPWKVCPTTTVSAAPFERDSRLGGSCCTSAAPNAFAITFAASFAPATSGW